MKTLEAQKTKISAQIRTFRPVMASAKGEDGLPTRIELLKIGLWMTPGHGDFIVTPEDLAQYKENFDNGVAQVTGSGDPDGIMIDYEHQPGIAAGWIKGLVVENDTLIGEVTWTAKGKEDLLGENFKYISPEFYPACRGGWEDPEHYGMYIPNVLAAAGLVNRPLFKGLKPIMASATSGNSGVGDKNVIYISASEKENSSMQLDQIRAKENDALTEQERQFLVENKGSLTVDEATKFGFEVKGPEAPAPAAPATEAPVTAPVEEPAAPVAAPALGQPVAASAVKGDEGNVVLAAAEVKAMRDKVVDLETKVAAAAKEEIKQRVAAHAARGAIKTDDIDKWTEKVAADAGLEDLLKGLNDNAVVAAGTIGSNANAGDVTGSAVSKLSANAQALIKASADAGNSLSFGDAMSQARKADPALAKEADEEIKGN